VSTSLYLLPHEPPTELKTSIRYTLLQVFSKFGKVTKLDFLFHKTGLLKGKPRGYAFVEYGNKDVSSFIHLHSLFFLLEGEGGDILTSFAISLGRS
jgi:hypothetical protein